MKERLLTLMTTEHLSARKLAVELGVQPSAISHILSGRNKPSYDFIIKLITVFPKYHPEWLLLGIGPMIKTETNDIVVTEVLPSQPELPMNVAAGDDSVVGQEQPATSTIANAVDEFVDGIEHEKPAGLSSVQCVTKDSVDECCENVKPPRGERVSKVMLFFDDNTFELYNPR